MAIDPLSPIAPARIRALLLPVGRIKRSRFLAFVELLQPQCMVRLGDVSPDPRPDRNMFSPLAFPGGILLYDLSTSMPPPSHLSLSPFEQFREPLLIIALADAREYPQFQQSRGQGRSDDANEPEDEDATEIRSAVEDLREQFPKAYLHTMMLFDTDLQTRHPQLPPETLFIPPTGQLKTTTMKTIMCDLTSTLLAELTSLAKSIQALPTVTSPSSQSGTTEYVPSWAGTDPASAQFSRRNSQVPNASRPESPVSNLQKDIHRMSMPVLPSASGGSLTIDHTGATSPTTEGARTPPTTFDEISGIDATKTLHRSNSNSKPNGAARDPSADRVSIHGFGSGGVGERARNKGRGRISVIIGTLYLCAGQWHDALRELTDGATLAKASSDHLWHAKALENTLVCLLLFAWSGMDFQIPQICYPIFDKSSTKALQMSLGSASSNAAALTPSSNEAALESLNALIPDLVNMILSVYTRAANFAGESMPPLAFSECVVRFSKLLAAMNLSAGYLDDDALRHLVQNTPFRQKPRLSVPRLSVNPTRNDIATTLFRALPGPPESSGMGHIDRVVVLAGVASVLSSLELQRKKAIVMKEFITSLIPGLVQARKVGAAEMGVHPAAGLAALNMASGNNSGAGALNLGEGEVENGIDEFLGLLGRIYGIPDARGTIVAATPEDNSRQAVITEILRISSLRAFGSVALKLDILRMCIHFCEALPDFNGVLHFTSLLLRLAGPGTAPKPNSTDVFVALSREEQTRLFSNISRTVAASTKLGLEHVETEYWDDFLVRGLYIMEEPVPLRLTHHRSAELKAAMSAKSPFIHNPWNRQPQSGATETVLVANEEYRFLIALQNPYDFELEIEHLRIAAKGVQFTAHEERFFLGPYRTQKFQIAGTAQSSGALEIIGCNIKVIGCRERLFPIFAEPWKPERELKMKRIGLNACLDAPVSRPPSAVAPAIDDSKFAPKPDMLQFTVIPDQPVLVVTEVSLPQAALMVLEGEKKRFNITVKNMSQATAVDFVHITFHDSATAAIQAATSNRDLPPSELHELEVQLAHYPSLRWCKAEDEENISIEPGQEARFEIEVIGRPRLTDAAIQIDYANLGKRRSDVTDRFFTRHLSVPISITVNASVQLQRPDIVPLSGDFAWPSQSHEADRPSSATLTPSSFFLNQNDSQFKAFLQKTSAQNSDVEYCMLLLDLRNSWPNPLHISLQIRAPPAPTTNDDDNWDIGYATEEVIQPGHINRVVLILPKIYIADPHAPVPSLNPANQRQFVVSTSKIAPEAERATREAFWFRHELLKIIRGTWKEAGNGRHGDLELRTMRFSPRMVDAIKLEDISITSKVVPDFAAQDDGLRSIRSLGRARFGVPIDSFLTLQTTIYNRSPAPISPFLRIQPHLAALPHTIALDLDKRLSWSGVLQRRLPPIPPQGSVQSKLGLVALSSGVYEIGVMVDEVEADGAREKEGEKKAGTRARSATENLLQANILGKGGLRSWYSKADCVIVARRGE